MSCKPEDLYDRHSRRVAYLRLLIEEAGNQSKLAKLTGVKQASLSAYVNNRKLMTAATAIQLERGMKKRPGWMDQWTLEDSESDDIPCEL